MKTHIVPHETISDVYAGREFLHPDGTYEHLSATEAVHAVKPIKPCLMDERDVIEGLKQRIKGLLADAEALNDEIDQLNRIAREAFKREVAAVRRCETAEARCEKLEAALKMAVTGLDNYAEAMLNHDCSDPSLVVQCADRLRVVESADQIRTILKAHS